MIFFRALLVSFFLGFVMVCVAPTIVWGAGTTLPNVVLDGGASVSGSSGGYTLLEPSILVHTGGTSADPGTYLQNIYYFMIGAAGVLAVLMIAIGGVEYMFAGANPGKEKEAKEKIMAAIYGLILALSAWLILNTINSKLTSFNLTLSKAVVTGSGGAGSGTSGDGDYSGGGGGMSGDSGETGSWGTIVDANGQYTADKISAEQLLRESLSGATNGDAVVTSTSGSSEPCQYPGQTGCTDLYGIKAATINEVVHVANNTDGKVYVTGGTETGHTTSSTGYDHAGGYKVDVDDTANVTNYVTANFTRTPSLDRSGTYAATAYVNEATGAIWYKESTHWDVLVKP